ncbi:restriction endonuclease subunit S [Corynebacterium diphtheriae]|uniref:restriction endonuclease subunit S n=1 Tax=Corynebacterium diphtheriae TaxID=1717 RepID=UPI0013CD250F|nr:restriction endonuclease subunit S [Corynebacterium diphtheriae bv. mitis]MBN4653169.1 restriction endonuclease subunit S [Corynebacterium diphtheriae bv. mitis]CAB0816884.1 restriction endonuclease subunit S [Corynebacterium diphtheriae]
MKIRDIGVVFDGPHATPKRVDSGKYFLNISSLENGRLKLENSDHVVDEDFARWTKRVQPRKDDLLFSYETRLGEAALMPEGIEACLGRRMGLIRPNSNKINSRFLLYYWLSPAFQNQISARTLHGSTVPRISIKELPDWEIEVPEISQQSAIADVLGALDDKIAANQRVMAISYQLIRTIGATVQEFVDLGAVAQIDRKSVTPAMMNGKTVQLHSIPGFDAGQSELVDGETIKSGKFLLEGPRVLVSKLNPLTPRVWHTSVVDQGEIAVCSTEFIPFSSGEVPNSALYASLIQPEFSSRLSEYASGTSNSHQRVKPEDMLVTPIRDPRALTDIELERLEALDNMISALTKENQALARTRDELLPLLMSGKITVAEAEQEVEGMGVEKRAEGAGDV